MDECSKFFQSMIDVSDCLEIRSFADAHGYFDLKAQANRYIRVCVISNVLYISSIKVMEKFAHRFILVSLVPVGHISATQKADNVFMFTKLSL